MRYKQRVIKHNIDVPKNIPSDEIKLTEIEYDPSVISHHPKSFEYYFTHGILINDERYIIKEFYVKNEDVYAVVTKDEVKYFELRMNYCSKAVLDKIIADLDKVKNAVEHNAPVLNGRTLTVNGSSVELPNDLQELSLNGNKLSLSKGNSVDLPEYKNTAYDDTEVKNRLIALESKKDNDTIYDDTNLRNRVASLESKRDNDNQTLTLDGRTISISGGNSITLPEDRDTTYNDSDLKRRITELEGRTDNFVSGIGVSREGNKVKLTYTFIDGTHKEVEFEDKDTKSIAYDDSALKARVLALEGRRDNDNQTLTLNDRTLSISNGNSVTLPSDKQTISKQGNKLVLSNGGGEIDLPTPKDSVPYDDTALRNRVKVLEDKPAPAKQKLSLSGNTLSLTDGGSVTLPDNNQPMHRFYNGDIPGRADNNTVVTVQKSNFSNPDGIKVGDTVEDYYSNSRTINRGIWKITEISGNNVKVQGISNYDTNIARNLSFNANTRSLSIESGNSVTIPSDKQTISKNGNKIVLSNGGGEVEIPTATPYNDADIKRRLGVLEAKPDNDKQTLSINGNTLSISNGNSVNIPQPNLSGYVPVDEYNKVKGALEKLLTDLKGSGAWIQTGSTVFEGSLDPNRHLATGNINLFGGTTDGNAFIRTNNGSTENDLAGGI